ncbi:uncharacterized protein LOC111004568 [Momordica charantia]|uniref:Uncharacterized protein LOC111004568 n=1 Tax=Momordica charantia TaxID=3673 RepID=A0A6J1BPV3_MOMCH|nr:uncharacterized protein LOC111004568 [Momordica charantia]
MAANPRESRRRRILERGSDRLALITGQIQSLPSPSPSPSPYAGTEDSSTQPLISDRQDLQPRISDQHTVSDEKGKLVGSTLQHKDPQIDARSSAYHGTSSAPLSSKHKAVETAVASTQEDVGKAPPRLARSEGQNSSLSTLGRDQCYNPKLPPVTSFSLNELSSAISESEMTRLCFSATIAFLVVASYVGFPFLGQSLTRIGFGSRPLYLLLLTNVTVVLGRLLFTKKKGFRGPHRGDGQVTPLVGQSSIEQIGKVLEAGLLVQKAMGAIFMDCSVFAVIVVSGLSFVQQL